MPATDRPHPPRKHASGVVVPEEARGLRRALAGFLWVTLEALLWTLRWEIHDPHGTVAAVRGRPVVFAIWHNRLALSLAVHRRYFRRAEPARGLAGLVSASRDGGLLARVMTLSGVVPIRGSTSRRGPQALRELVRVARRGLDIAVTPDGPRGPRLVVQPGVVASARITGFPIVPVTIDAHPHLTLRSWDRFQVPLPFARCRVSFGLPLEVPREDTEADLEQARETLQARLLELSGDA